MTPLVVGVAAGGDGQLVVGEGRLWVGLIVGVGVGVREGWIDRIDRRAYPRPSIRTLDRIHATIITDPNQSY